MLCCFIYTNGIEEEHLFGIANVCFVVVAFFYIEKRNKRRNQVTTTKILSTK